MVDEEMAARLDDAVRKLHAASCLEEVQHVVRSAARALSGADGATFVLREGDQCYYADEDAVSPLWKGQRFPLTACISGWAMLTGETAVIPNIALDDRIPQAAYRPTFVKALAMVPVGENDPVGAIGAYWATTHTATDAEVARLRSLAAATAQALTRHLPKTAARRS